MAAILSVGRGPSGLRQTKLELMSNYNFRTLVLSSTDVQVYADGAAYCSFAELLVASSIITRYGNTNSNFA